MEEIETGRDISEGTPIQKVGRKRSLQEDFCTLSLDMTGTRVSAQPSSPSPPMPPTPVVRKKRRCYMFLGTRTCTTTSGDSEYFRLFAGTPRKFASAAGRCIR